jgi:type I restriction enzyme M protein
LALAHPSIECFDDLRSEVFRVCVHACIMPMAQLRCNPLKKTDVPPERFVERALESLQPRGQLAVILPTSLLVKREKGQWREQMLKENSLLAVCQMPNELFQPFASSTTSIVLLEKGVPHEPRRKTVFVRVHYDGFTLKKGIRVARSDGRNEIPDAIDAILNKTVKPGFSGVVSVSGRDEWAVGGYIPSAPASEDELKDSVDVLLRRLASFYTRYAAEVVAQRAAIKGRDLDVVPYRSLLTIQRLANAAALHSAEGTIGETFDIFYGMKELHSREGIPPGRTLIISPTEEYNGCYGWLEFNPLLEPPFVTVAQTGSIGEAFVQMEPCAVNDDCLVLLPKEGKQVTEAQLVITAASLHLERWRFTYGRKLTPSRIADFVLPLNPALKEWVVRKLADMRAVVRASLKPYENELNAALARSAGSASTEAKDQERVDKTDEALPLLTSSAEEVLHILRTGVPKQVEDGDHEEH